ncbi:MAG: HyaD/HybD family hydrogenase maturation endopeptidase [Deltaproteobacteria bacterium]|nr:HyaD/HybD family hydrogenase maturation endopeptidase [Deltaproteobacteria bacterium]
MNIDHIIVLGIGNILQTDEGVGVRVAHELDETHDFPTHVEIVDGGVLGLSLIAIIERADYLIVVDAAKLGGQPGDLYRVPWEEIPDRTKYKDSLHQVDFVETMSVLPLIAKTPKTVIIAVEPKDITTWGLSMTPVVASKIPALCRMVLDELKSLGVEATLKEFRTNVFSLTRPNPGS